MKRLVFMATAVLLTGFGLAASPARAGYLVTLMEQNGNVVATGSGTIDLTDLTFFFSSAGGVAGVGSGNAFVATGLAPGTSANSAYQGFTGPTSIGTGDVNDFIAASTGSGDFVAIGGLGQELAVPEAYLSGNPLSDTMTFDNQTIASLDLTPGTYVWNWGTGAHADSFTLQIIPPVTAAPEPASLTLLGMGAAGLLGYGWRRRPSA